jgi:hypothetical protein
MSISTHGTISTKDKTVLRPLAERYAEIAAMDVQKERIERYYDTISLKEVRPVVLIDEIPWGEIRDEALRNQCEDPALHRLEGKLRRVIYQWDHFQADMVVPPTFHVRKQTHSTGIGIEVQDTIIKGDTGAYIMSHGYSDQLADEEALAKLTLPRISYDEAGTEAAAAVAREVFDGLMPVEIRGISLIYNIWDRIATYRGVDNLLMDLAVRPEFMHQTARRFMEIGQAMFTQYLELGLMETNPYVLHCTPACARELPAPDFAGTLRPKDVWGRCSAQIFSAVSPAMHDEFDLQYSREIFGDCGLLYYGCCEPLDTKIDILRKRFANLRKVSITPWADADRAADAIGSDYVLAAKPNPAFVNSPEFDPKPVEEEVARYLAACRRNGTTTELVLKDISTIANCPENLTKWAQTVSKVVDQYY